MKGLFEKKAKIFLFVRERSRAAAAWQGEDSGIFSECERCMFLKCETECFDIWIVLLFLRLCDLSSLRNTHPKKSRERTVTSKSKFHIWLCPFLIDYILIEHYTLSIM